MKYSILTSAFLSSLALMSANVHAIDANQGNLTLTEGEFIYPNKNIALNSVSGFKLEVLADNITASAKIRGTQVSGENSSIILGTSTTQSVVLSTAVDSHTYSPVTVFGMKKGKTSILGKSISISTHVTDSNSSLEPNGIQIINGATLQLGDSSTETLEVTAEGGTDAIGIFIADQGQASITAQTMTVTSDYTALHVRNATADLSRPSDAATLTIASKNINLTGGSIGVAAMSNGVLEMNGNVTITAPNAILARGNSLVNINTDETSSNYATVINGNIAFSYDGPTSGTGVNAEVNINLNGEQSSWTGNVLVEWNELNPDKLTQNPSLLTVKDFNLSLSNGAEWTPSIINDSETDAGEGTLNGQKYVSLNHLNLSNGVINIENAAQTVKIDELKGNGGTINLRTAQSDEGFTTGTLAIDELSEQAAAPILAVNYVGITADDLANPEQIATLGGITVGTDATDAKGLELELNVAEGDVQGAVSQNIGADGTEGAVQQAVNQKLDGYSSIAALSAVQWRHENDTLLKRMGELRDAQGTVGAWARIYGSEQEYGAQSVTAKNTTVQVGADYDVGSGWKVGGAFSYTEGSSSFDMGESDSNMYAAAVYGTWLADNGQFVDLIAKYSRLSNEFTSGTMKGDFDNNAFSVAAEYGWHFALNDLAFVEPSAGVTYGRIMGDDFMAHNGVKVEQDDYDSLIGRLGVRSGFYFPNQKGTVYARAAVLHDFMGDMESTASKANSQGTIQTSHLKEELGDTWIEYAIGANFNLSKTAYTFVDLEKTAGGDVKESWKWTIGARMAF